MRKLIQQYAKDLTAGRLASGYEHSYRIYQLARKIGERMEYDDEVCYHATRKLYDLSRGHDARPWCLTVSFTHPHDPYVARKKYWDW